MKGPKLTAYSFILFALILALSSCEKNADKKITMEFEKKDIPLTGASETPANASPALGLMDVAYSKETRTLSYTVKWSGLTDSVMLMHIHGLGPTGFAAGIVQNIVHTSNSIFPQKTSAGKYTFSKTGSISGVLLADGVLVKENALPNGNFYINITTSV